MKKIILIAQREYLTRVRKKSFIVMTFVGPLLFSLLILAPILINKIKVEKKRIQVIDESNLFNQKFPQSDQLEFVYSTVDLKEAKTKLLKSSYDGLLYIPNFNIDQPIGFQFFSEKNPSLDNQMLIERIITTEIENLRMKKAGIDKSILEKIKASISIETINLSEKGEKSSSAVAATSAGFVFAFLTYMFIFVYGAQVMRGVIEEKTNRIIEVVVSSVKPFQLMMGKITGIASVGFTQIIAWVILSGTIYIGITNYFQPSQKTPIETEYTVTQTQNNSTINTQQQTIIEIKKAMESINLPLILGCFIFYFIGGYLFYASLFAAIGSAVDSEADTQQFMLPITMPIILSLIFAQFVIRDPDGHLAFWLSIIPISSPIIMMVRLPFGVPAWQIILSMLLLIGGFIGTTWLASKIYRIGILIYGKKPTYRQLIKWLTTKV